MTDDAVFDAPPPPRARSPLRIALVSVLVVIIVVWGGVWWWRAHRTGVHFRAMFTAAVGVYPGSDVRMLGVPVGLVDSVQPQGTQVVISMHLNPGVHAPADTDAVIVTPNLVGDRYIQLTGAGQGGAQLTSGTTIPPDRTRTPVELDDLYKSLLSLATALGPDGANSDGALNRLLQTGAANLDGNGTALNQTIKQLAAASSTLAGSQENIFGTIDNLSLFTKQLQTNNNALVTLNQELGSVSQTLADDRQSFAEALQQLGTALNLVQGFVRDNRAALSSNVLALAKVANTLAGQKESVSKALSAAPVLVQNFIRAYDPQNNLLRGRADLNELTVWAQQQSAAVAATPASTSTGPPTLLPSSDVTTAGPS